MCENNRPPNEPLQQRLKQLKKTHKEKQREAQKIREERQLLSEEFNQSKRFRSFIQKVHPRRIKQTIRTIGAYILVRRNRRQLYSRTYKRKQASNDILPYTKALYTKGFTKKALTDLRTMYAATRNKYLKEAIAWELALWHARFLNEHHANEALTYLQTITINKLDQTDKRKRGIIAAECYIALGKYAQAKQIIKNILTTDKHPDLYLAFANCEKTSVAKLTHINKVFHHFALAPLPTTKTITHYDELTMETPEKIKDSTKISVILPAYNSETGIKIAIESILNQTWQNLELLIIDDCSTDNTWEVIQQYAKEDERIRIFQTEKNSGPYVARNIGLKHATGHFVTINDADDWSHAEKLAIQAKHLLANENIIANTSEQARLLENLMFYRRGTPGTYIFSNMSSLMFRRKPIIEKIGYWDSVRFAADGEFKRRLIKVFGANKVIDLETGPLSFPRQSKTSLTASSAFGYDGFFMGARQEYVASFTHYHATNKNMKYPSDPKEQTKRLFPVPDPMLPKRQQGPHQFDIAIAADFHEISNEAAELIVSEIKINRKLGLSKDLIQMHAYKLKRRENPFNPKIRNIIDGENVQVVVYGEEVSCKLLLVRTPVILQERQLYLPKIKTIAALIVIDELPLIEYNDRRKTNYNVRQCLRHLMIYTNRRGRWYPLNERIRQQLMESYTHEFRSIRMAYENWFNEPEKHYEDYVKRIDNWLIDE